jgi:hypothetical protein
MRISRLSAAAVVFGAVLFATTAAAGVSAGLLRHRRAAADQEHDLRRACRTISRTLTVNFLYAHHGLYTPDVARLYLQGVSCRSYKWIWGQG